MTQIELVRLSTLTEDNLYERGGNEVYDPTGDTVYGSGSKKLGKIQDALVDASSGRVSQFIVKADGSSTAVLVPVGDSRIDDQGVYFDSLTKEKLGHMPAYREGQALELPKPARAEEDARTPDKLRLLEERLMVSKDRFKAGSVEIGKHVESHEVSANVDLKHDEVVIERRAVDNPKLVEGAELGDKSKTINVDLEAERANVSKQAYVTEEVSVGKRTVTDSQTVSETVGREVLEVNKAGDVRLEQQDEKAESKRKS